MIATHKAEPSMKDMKKSMKEQVEAMKQKRACHCQLETAFVVGLVRV